MRRSRAVDLRCGSTSRSLAAEAGWWPNGALSGSDGAGGSPCSGLTLCGLIRVRFVSGTEGTEAEWSTRLHHRFRSLVRVGVGDLSVTLMPGELQNIADDLQSTHLEDLQGDYARALNLSGGGGAQDGCLDRRTWTED